MTALPPEQAIERHLARRLSKVREFGLAGPHELAEACSAVEALERAGGLSAEDAAEWSRRIVRTAQGPGPGDPQRRARALDFVADLVSREGGDRARVVAEAFRRLGLLSDQDELALLWPSLLDEDIEDDVDAFRGAGGFRDDRPLRVVPGPSQRVGGLRVTVIELFAAAVSVHWHFDSRLARGGPARSSRG